MGPRFRGDDRWPDDRWLRFAKMPVGFVSPKCISLACPGRSAARSGALQTRDRFSLWRSRISDAPLRWRSRCVASGTHDTDDPCIFLFFCGFGIFHPRSHDLKHTHTSSFPRRILRPGFCIVASLTPNRGVGGAPRNVRVLSGTPVGRIMCVKDARERGYDAIRQAPSEAPCVP
jgi:hypothetical protein